MAIAEDIAEFEQLLGELIIKYEQYFLGLEKREPVQLAARVERAARAYANFNIVNTMLKFKYNATVARLNSYRQYWNRILRLMEEGHYSRDQFKMELHLRQTAKKPELQPRKSADETTGETELIYRQFIEARKACNLSTANVSHEAIASLLEKQKPLILQKYRCQQVEFQVVIEGGQPKIKARPKTGR